jgi:hypothetical protein
MLQLMPAIAFSEFPAISWLISAKPVSFDILGASDLSLFRAILKQLASDASLYVVPFCLCGLHLTVEFRLLANLHLIGASRFNRFAFLHQLT